MFFFLNYETFVKNFSILLDKLNISYPQAKINWWNWLLLKFNKKPIKVYLQKVVYN